MRARHGWREWQARVDWRLKQICCPTESPTQHKWDYDAYFFDGHCSISILTYPSTRTAPPQDRHQAGRLTQAKKRGRESPVRTEKRARQWECLVTSTRVPRPAPDISKKMGPKNWDKEG